MTKKTENTAAPRCETEANNVIALLKRNRGATLDELAEVTGWLSQTAWAAMTGLKKEGHVIERTKVEGVNRYAITATEGSCT